MIRKSGFTLAEVLITLGIIGVVAAMTIPTLMNQTGQVEFKTGFKKAVSVLNQAITMNVALDGDDFSNLTNGTVDDPNSIFYMFTSRMNVIRTATEGATDLGASPLNTTSNYTLFFSDGMAISFPKTSTACTSTNKCNMIVDVNGAKGPNTLSVATTGRPNDRVADQFYVNFYNQQVEAADDSARFVLYN